MFYSKKLKKQKKIKHCFFSRKRGFSKGVYKSLNCGIGSKDNKKNIKRNLKIVKNKICKKTKGLSKIDSKSQKQAIKLVYWRENTAQKENKPRKEMHDELAGFKKNSLKKICSNCTR